MIKKLSDVTIPVSDLKETVDFYEKVLGLKKKYEWADYVAFDCGGVELAFEPGGSIGKKEGSPYIFLLVDNVDTEYQELKSKGVKFEGEPHDTSWGARVVCLRDPDETWFTFYKGRRNKGVHSASPKPPRARGFINTRNVSQNAFMGTGIENDHLTAN